MQKAGRLELAEPIGMKKGSRVGREKRGKTGKEEKGTGWAGEGKHQDRMRSWISPKV